MIGATGLHIGQSFVDASAALPAAAPPRQPRGVLLLRGAAQEARSATKKPAAQPV
ncbi:hypothetical protein [Rhodococcus sp. KRD162]|uniref:hypothetical protein n=1 Tax=Rhodococcus sp. KRD162 TaxID=2729725 RepID=UPI0019D2D74B|nr:hypothetical protein [Rhodococcus sp. KRD162]